jgi:hypothetical protein
MPTTAPILGNVNVTSTSQRMFEIVWITYMGATFPYRSKSFESFLVYLLFTGTAFPCPNKVTVVRSQSRSLQFRNHVNLLAYTYTGTTFPCPNKVTEVRSQIMSLQFPPLPQGQHGLAGPRLAPQGPRKRGEVFTVRKPIQ